MKLDLDPDSFVATEHADLFHRNDLKSHVSLTDGGAYDNLGIHAIRDCPVILASDGSTPLRPTRGKWFTTQFNQRMMRPMETAVEQTRAIRRHELVSKFQNGQKKGTLWYAGTDVRNYPIPRPFEIRSGWSTYFGAVRTRLNSFSHAEKSLLINWGY